jgi:aryl carrier-like protein
MMSADIERRGRAMREWCERVRQRGDRAQVEELEDLPCLRAAWLMARAAERARAGRP